MNIEKNAYRFPFKRGPASTTAYEILMVVIAIIKLTNYHNKSTSFMFPISEQNYSIFEDDLKSTNSHFFQQREERERTIPVVL